MSSAPIAGPGRYSIYTGRVTNWPMVILTVALALLVLPLALNSSEDGWGAVGLPLILLLAVGILLEVATGTSVRAAVGPRGVTVRWGLIGWPRVHYPLADIMHAEVVDIAWWWVTWGFWWTPRRTCCTARSGPTLRLVLRNGRTVTVTVPDPDAALASLQDARAGRTG